MAHSSELWPLAQTLIPGGVNSPVRAFKGVGGEPIFFQQGQGAYLIDVNNKRYVDYVGSWGPLILGHAHPAVISAVQKAASLGLGFGAPTPIEVEMAKTLTRLVPSLDKVRLLSTGTEATQTALRLARGYTQRKKIVKFEGGYHGHADSLLVKAGSGCTTLGQPDSAGVLEEFAAHTLTLPFNDLSDVERLFSNIGNDIAAIIVEPICGNMNCIPPKDGFLAGLRSICDRYSSLLIFDEVITGFRVDLHSAQGLYEITPDLTCLGKIIGGGLPVAALGGKKVIMDYLSPNGPVYQAGTLSGNPVAVSAGLATLQELEKPGLYASLNQKTQRLTENLSQLAKERGIPLLTQRVGSLFGIFFSDHPSFANYQEVMAHCNKENFKKFFHGMLKEGVYFAPSAFESAFISSAHTDEIIDYTLEAAQKVFKYF